MRTARWLIGMRCYTSPSHEGGNAIVLPSKDLRSTRFYRQDYKVLGPLWKAARIAKIMAHVYLDSASMTSYCT